MAPSPRLTPYTPYLLGVRRLLLLWLLLPLAVQAMAPTAVALDGSSEATATSPVAAAQKRH